MEASEQPAFESVATRAGVRPIEFHATGLRHPRSIYFGDDCFTPYDEITHLGLGPFGLRLASLDGVYLLRRRAFATPGGAQQLAASLVERIRLLPGGAAQLARMLELDRRASRPGGARVTHLLVVLCLVGFALQRWVGAPVDIVGMFSAPLVSRGELWRLVTANLLHGSLVHLVLNVACLFVLGTLAERSLGSLGLAFVAAVAAVGAMLGSWLAGYTWALGASGIVAGLAGALLWLEFRRSEELPAGWRIPRRIFVGAIVVETLALTAVPGVAHAAHLAGLLAGGLATYPVAPPYAARRRRWLVPANAVATLLLVASVGTAVRIVRSVDPESIALRAEALLAIEGLPPLVLNNEAWRIAVAENPAPEALEAALRLAERAVAETGRGDANVLDTLAEVQFAAGQREEAVATIDEAIALAPDVAYFQEQRRRFTGDRDAGDRPDPPAPGEVEPRPPDEDSGLRV